MRLVKIIAICNSFFFLLNAEAQKPNTKVLLKINREKTSVADFLKSYNKNRNTHTAHNSENLRNYLDLYINYRLKVIEAKALKMDTISKLQDELDGYFKKLAVPYLINNQVFETLICEAYERSKLDIRASHILIRCEENALPEDTLKAYQKALELKQQAIKGVNFNSLAVEFSDDHSARDQTNNQNIIIRKGNAGDLGYFTVFNMVYPFETAAYQTPIGHISDPIRTRFGYHLLKPTDKREALGQAKVAHIFLSRKGSDKSEKEQKDKIFSIYQMLLKGSNFEQLVEQYSEDHNTKSKGGVLPVFGANDMVAEFYLNIFSINNINGFSKPIKTPYGWHIVKLLERSTPASFSDEKPGLEIKLKKDKRSEKTQLSYSDIIKKTVVFKEFALAKNEINSIINPELLNGNWHPTANSRLDKILIKIGKQKISQSNFVNFIAANQQKQSTTALLTYFEILYTNFVNEACENYFYLNMSEFHPELKSLMDEYKDGILLFELSNQMVWQPSINNEEELKSFFLQYRDDYRGAALKDVRGHVISDYQNQLEKEWIDKLREKYPVQINEKVLLKIINE